MPIPTYQAPQPTYAPQQYAVQPYAPPTYPASATNWQRSPVLAAQAPQTNPVKARGYAPEAKPAAPVAPAAPKTIQLPTPEELGLNSPAREASPTPPATAQAKVADAVDWNQTHARLRDLGAVGFHLDHLPGGITRVRVTIPTANGGHPVEAIASSDAAAIATMFERATVR